MNSQFQYQTNEFNYPPQKPSTQLVELFTEFVNNNLSELRKSTNRDKVKKGLILQYFVGAFPELTEKLDQSKYIFKSSLISNYNKMDELNALIDYTLTVNISKQPKTGGSKKKKQVHKKKSKKLN